MSNNTVQFLDAESGKLYEFNLDNEVEHLHYEFEELAASVDDETYIYPFDYRIVKFDNDKKGFAIIISYWQEGGKVFGCPYCALYNAHKVIIVDESLEETNRKLDSLVDFSNGENVFYTALLRVHIPMKAYTYFYDALTEKGYIDLTVNSYA